MNSRPTDILVCISGSSIQITTVLLHIHIGLIFLHENATAINVTIHLVFCEGFKIDSRGVRLQLITLGEMLTFFCHKNISDIDITINKNCVHH